MMKRFRVIQHKIIDENNKTKVYSGLRLKSKRRNQHNHSKPVLQKIIHKTFKSYEKAERFAYKKRFECFNVQCIFLGDTPE